MQVDVEEMRSGANRSYNAASFAMEGADQLSRSNVGAGIFGDFSAAESFHGALSEAHSNHIQRRRQHETHLGVLGDKGHKTASVFVEMEERNAEALRSEL
ncbi:DUF2563 family protein [Mycolicibacterium sarraceniae]|uniref:DUF2563 family protein n=1 Tax=Mycolicibacterium sarraceniae TaxID=1534348 RepID=A0A7I7SSI8_9MYCO|nr:DUF2563 family protein [Mycolicibacterium sarraceniae]BBY59109.1 hypothetical protein MSAR_22450 [Mycolicibacterium sarraceniae]